MVLEKLNLAQYGLVDFETIPTGGLKKVLKLKNGYHVSIVTNFGGNRGYYGNWEDQTFEMAALDQNSRYQVFDQIDDGDYQINGGIWPHLSTKELIEKIKIVENL